MKPDNPWLRYARDDFRTLELVEAEGLSRMVCFHAQQTVEKLLKALVFEKHVTIPRTHDLVILAKTAGAVLPVTNADLEFLSEIYVDARYPLDAGLLPHGDPTPQDAERAARIARCVYGMLVQR